MVADNPNCPPPGYSPEELARMKKEEEIDYKRLLKLLLNKVNRVTSAHRHQNLLMKADLDALCDRQIEVEAVMNQYKSSSGGSHDS